MRKANNKSRTRNTANNTIKGLLALPDAVLVHIMSFFVDLAIDIDSFLSIQCVSRRFHLLANSNDLWHRSSHILTNGALNMNAFRFIKEKCKGTEGTCCHGYSRKDKKEYAIKRARVYPDNEGVPYYMMRELAALRKISNKHICELVTINLHDFKLYLLFPYIEKTLHDYMNPPSASGSLSEIRVQKHQVCSLTYQLLDAVNYCHKRGIVHRNLKPKHLLIIPGNGPDPLDNAQIKLADFALVRIIGHPPKKFTSEVITLWYRPPEILMGLKDYSTAVDVWSVGCIFAEMIEGKPLFMGLCEIDQLFQIFWKMSTPTTDAWPGFTDMPNYQSTLFPQWTNSQLYGLMQRADDEQFALLSSMLRFDPGKRASAHEALHHKYFDGPRQEDMNGTRINVESTSEVGDVHDLNKCFEAHDEFPSSSSSSFDTWKQIDPFDPDGLLYYHPKLIRLSKTTLQQNHFLRKLEGDYGIVDPCRRIDSHTRIGVIDRLIEILDAFEEHMSQRTVFFAASLIDKYTSTLDEMARRDLNIQLLGSTCLHIASKCEDVTYIGLKDLVPLGYEGFPPFDGKEILNLEEKVLNALNFDLYLPTTIDFVNVYTDCVPEFRDSNATVMFAKYISESSLFSSECINYSPSLVAAAIVVYSLHCSRNTIPWSETLEAVTQYKVEDLIIVMKELFNLHERLPSSAYRTVYERYKRDKFASVSSWRPTSIDLVKFENANINSGDSGIKFAAAPINVNCNNSQRQSIW